MSAPGSARLTARNPSGTNNVPARTKQSDRTWPLFNLYPPIFSSKLPPYIAGTLLPVGRM